MDLSLADFLALPDAEKVPFIQGRHVLVAEQFDRAALDHLCAVAEAARGLHRSRPGQLALGQLLEVRMALNFFAQPSSRTFLSFNTAQAWLGMTRTSIRDEKVSSMSKGESLVDSVRTFISYVDLVVMRHHDDGAAATAAWTASRAHRRIPLDDGEEVPVPVVNAGSGTRQHPTQALLDVYTLQKQLGGLDGRTLMLAGDLARGRTVRSLCLLIHNYRDVKLILASPERFQMLPDVLAHLERYGVAYRLAGSLEEGIEEADAVYMTRIQDEWDTGRAGHERAAPGFVFTMDHLRRMKPGSALLHPLPKRDEIEEAVDYVDDERVAYWRQERNGMWMRVAVLAHLFRKDQEILRLHRELAVAT
jgi:aspartate carbamoyltransferase catalytic subunit